MPSTFLRSSWERGHVNMILHGDLAVDPYYLTKQFSSELVVPNPNYNRRCLIYFNVWEGIGSKNAKHLFA